MTIVVIAVLIVVGALLFTFRIKESALAPVETEPPTQALEEAKARIYESLRDLQFEYRVGKLSDADYQAAKAELQKELARVLAQIDEFHPKGVKKPAPKPETAAASTPAPAAAPAPAPAAALVCPHCGATFQEALKFCGECGKPMEAKA